MSLLDRLVADSWVRVRDGSMVEGIKALALDNGDGDRERQGGPDKGSKRPDRQPLWKKGWIIHVDFSNLIPSVSLVSMTHFSKVDNQRQPL